MFPPSSLPLTVWAGRWAVCRLAPDAAVPAWASMPWRLSAIARTSGELSLLVPEQAVPGMPAMPVERGFRVIAVSGPVPFSVVGLFASLAVPLAEAGVSLFPLATPDVLFKWADRFKGDSGRRLTVLQRFVLLKLSRDNHDNVNFVPALREFGLADAAPLDAVA